jgi:tetratricopeptide (TPR) repeat protein/serine/threonine protein kinase
MSTSASLRSRSGSTEAVLADIVEEVTNKLHAGEPVDIEAYVGAHPEFAEPLRRLLPALAVLADLGRSAASGEAVMVSPAQATGADMGELGDFRIVREIGRGGMGIVYEAEQISLGRRVALKVLPFAATLDPRQLQRFQNEARAAAGLHHTNIVSVYYVGCERGVHFYAMQLIEGQTLAAVVHQLQQAKGLGPAGAKEVVFTGSEKPTVPGSPAPAGGGTEPAPAAETVAALTTEGPVDSPAYFRAVAQLGVQAAEALEHAHDEGVVHRDIKPANLLVDAKGKLWITDFGLAHCRAGAELTMTGDVVGTLRYMSPEQALGKRLLVDHRTDIYSLGVTLYEFLTLEPAFPGSDREEVLRQIASEEPRPPRRINKAIPAELETIVLKAMGKSPAERYATAQELADDLRRFLDDKPIRARRPRLVRRLVKWGRRHRPLVAAGGALLLAAALLGGGNLWWLGRQRAEAERAVAGYLQQAGLLQEQGRWDEAGQVLARAEERLAGGGPAGLLEQVRRLRDEADWVAELEEARLCAADVDRDGLFSFAGADLAYGEAFARRGLDLGALNSGEVAARIRASAVRARLVEALDNWAFTKEKLRAGSGEGLRALAARADDDPWRRRLRQLTTQKDRVALGQLAGEEDALAQLATSLVLLSAALDATGEHAGAERLLRRAQQLHPGDFWTNFELAGRLVFATGPSARQEYEARYRDLGVDAFGRIEQGIGFYRAALAVRPQSAVVHNNVGFALFAQGRLAEAVDEFRNAIALCPEHAGAHCSLGTALCKQGQAAEAVEVLRKAIALKPDYPLPHCSLGTALQEQGKLAEAEAAFRKAIALRPHYPEAHYNLGNALYKDGKLAEAEAAFRKAINLQADYHEAHGNLGVALRDQGNLAEAVDAFHKAIALKPDYPEAHTHLGNALQEQGKLPDAVEAHRKAIALRPDYPEAHNNLGIALNAQGKLAEAVAAYRKAIALKPDYPKAYWNLGNTLRAQGKSAEAVAAYRKAIALKPDYPEAYVNLGAILCDEQARPGEAEAVFRKAIGLRADYPEAHFNLGMALQAQGELAAAEAAYRKAIALRPDDLKAHVCLGKALQDQGKLAEAEAAFRKAIALRVDDPEAHFNLGRALRHQGKLAAAEAAYRKAIMLRPDFPEAHCNLGRALHDQGRFIDALAALKRGHELGSRKLQWSYPSAQWVQDCERLIQLDGKLPAVLSGKEQPADPAERVALAELCQLPCKKYYAAAVRFYGEAFAAPKSAGDRPSDPRYNAACAAALAGCGLGEDADTLDTTARARLRQQALDWLRADLAVWRKVLEGDRSKAAPGIRKQMQHWLQDVDFAGVRGPQALAQLPEAECTAWRQLWAEVEELFVRAGASSSGAEK